MQKTRKLKLLKVHLWIFTFCMMLGTVTYAQETKATGVITDQKSGAAITGATVTVKGTGKATVTDNAGRYIIQAAPGDILIVTFTGRLSKEIKVGANGETNVVLAEDFNKLDEVVVIGYGTQKKKLVTGANLQVKGDDIKKQSTTSALQALQGQASGVQITSASGQPGDGFNIIIRGKGTIGNFGPLIIVDGVQGVNLNSINPGDIESIDVLKDAASAAIYGSQAANGVILVTTRTGRQNQKAQISLDAYYGVQNVARKADLLNAKEYAIIMNEQAINSGNAPYFSNDVINNLPVNTNWMDQMFVKNVPTQNYVFGATGGSAGSVYSTSLGYTTQGGIVGGKDMSYYERYTFKMNSEHNLYSNIIKLGEHLTFNSVNNHGIQTGGQYNNTLRGAFGANPFLPMYDSAGNFFSSDQVGWFPGKPDAAWDNTTANPYASMYYGSTGRNNNQGLFGDAYLQIEPIKGLKLRTSLGLNYWSNQSNGYGAPYHLSVFAIKDTSTVYQSMGNGKTLQFDNTLSYDFTVASDHSFSVMAGTSALKTRGSGLSGNNWDLRVVDLAHAYLDVAQDRSAQSTHLSAGGGPFESALQSYFGRLQYNFKEKYLFNATFRADGSSNFAPNHRWGYFPSVSAGWVASKENFMQTVTGLDFFKLRASWGRVGNQAIDAFKYLSLIRFDQAGYNFGPAEANNTQGARPDDVIGNPNIKWETSEQTDIGFDATVMRRLTINFDYYIKKTKDWLLQIPVLASTGASTTYINGGDVKNTGVELALNYRNTIGKFFNYSVGVNGSYNKNTIGNIPTNDHILHGYTNVLYANSLEFYRAANGMPVGYFWGLKTNGIFQTEEEVNNYKSKTGNAIQPGAKPGDVRYVDLNDDGIIDNNDRTKVGDPNPDFIFGFNVALDYKGFDFSLQASGVAGNQLVQSWKGPGGRSNYSTEILGRWTGPGTSNRIPRVTEEGTNFAQFSDLYVYDGSYLRINTITLGYDFSRIAKKNYLSKLRLYASVLNAFTFTKYNGMDPEVGHNDWFSSGIDLGYYPRPRTLLVGANIRF